MNNLFITLHGQSWANPWNGDINGSCSLTARKKSSYSGNNLAIFSAKGKNLQITSLQKKVALDLLAMSSCKCVCLYVSAWARLAMPLIRHENHLMTMRTSHNFHFFGIFTAFILQWLPLNKQNKSYNERHRNKHQIGLLKKIANKVIF